MQHAVHIVIRMLIFARDNMKSNALCSSCEALTTTTECICAAADAARGVATMILLLSFFVSPIPTLYTVYACTTSS